MENESMLGKADIMSDKYGKVKIKTTDGRVLVGVSWGIQPAIDNETGDELDFDCLVFKPDNELSEELLNEEILSIEKA